MSRIKKLQGKRKNKATAPVKKKKKAFSYVLLFFFLSGLDT